jgi:7-carboxy-7-deazaguanine synthase
LRINIQPIEKLDHRDDYSVDVHSIFHTIQGEGPFTGFPAIFVRLAGCNLQCPQCDTDYTDKRERMAPEAVVDAVRKLHPGPRLVVITGGEPFRQNITMLAQLLLDEEFPVQVETNGTLPPPPDFPHGVYIIVSPKAGKVHPETADRAIAVKYVLSANSVSPEDGLPLRVLDHTAPSYGVARLDVPPESIYLQPADMQDEYLNAANLEAVRRSCMKHGYILQLQVHKLLGVE